jgi:uncharacterized protein DUF3761
MKKLTFALLVASANLLVLFTLRARSQADEQPEHRKNYYNCLHGYSDCDSSQLTDVERTQVKQAAHQRNYNNCLHGYAGCDSSQLTDVERTQVQQAAHQRNYNNCLHGYAGCDPSQLTASEQESVAINKRDSTAAEPAQTTPPHFYTNKDGERVQSPTYSKTVPPGATAQCRDGTYSFSRNHRGTCSHHGGVAKWLD